MVFQEAVMESFVTEYAFRLPESCKRDPEYVRQMDNVLNTHLRHTFLFLGLTAVATMVALSFHKVLLTIVSDTTESVGRTSLRID